MWTISHESFRRAASVVAAWICATLAADGVAIELPAQVEPVRFGEVVRVSNTQEFQSAVDNAQPGTVIALAKDGKFAGLAIPDGQAGLTLRPDELEDSARVMVESLGAKPALAIGLRTSHIRVERLRFSLTHNTTDSIYYIGVRVGYDSAGTREANTVDELPHHIAFENCEIIGTDGGNIRVGCLLNARHASMIGCKIRDIHEIRQDSQGVLVTNSPGPVEIRSCDIEAAGENIMFGGSVATIPGLQLADATIIGNRLAKPVEWQAKQWACKNLLEFKGMRRALVEGNTLENCWTSAQNGTAVLVTPRDKTPGVGDITFRRNTIRNVGGGYLITSSDQFQPGGPLTGPILIDSDVITGVGAFVGNGAVFNIASPDGRPMPSIEVRNCLWTHTDAGKSVVLFEGVAQAVSDLTFQNCLGTHSRYGWIGSGNGPGEPTLARWAVRPVISGNTLLNGTPHVYSPAVKTGNRWLDVPLNGDGITLLEAAWRHR